MKKALVSLAVLAAVTAANAAVIVTDDFESVVGSRSMSNNGLYGGDYYDFFGIFNRAGNGPYAMFDDTLYDYAGDTYGIIPASYGENGSALGMMDIENGSNSSGTASITWEFDVTGYEDYYLTVDMGACGDFEAADTYKFEMSLDGATWVNVLAITANESLTLDYYMDNGAAVSDFGTGPTLNDPLQVQNGPSAGALLGNDLANYASATLEGQTNTLYVRFTTANNGSNELVVMDNVSVNGVAVPEPASLTLLALGAILLRRR